MSAGHGHKRSNLRHHAEVEKLLRTPDAQALMRRWQRLDVDHDIPDLAGYNVEGTVRFLDRDFFHALLDPGFAQHLGIGPIDTGLSANDTVDALLAHEGAEKVILDADNDVDTYEPAHELATAHEHEVVRQRGGSPIKYERGLKAAIAFCERKPVRAPALDLAAAPYIDEPDEWDHKVIAVLRQAGNPDASKLPRHIVDYSKSTGADQCWRCRSWQPDRIQAQFNLGRCAQVSGLVRRDRWCSRFAGVTRTFDLNKHRKWREKHHARSDLQAAAGPA